MKPKVNDFSDIDGKVVDIIKKEVPNFIQDALKHELADLIKICKLSVNEMKNEQVNLIRSGVVNELRKIIKEHMTRLKAEIVEEFREKI